MLILENGFHIFQRETLITKNDILGTELTEFPDWMLLSQVAM